MKTYDECYSEIEQKLGPVGNYPDKKYIWYGYKQGKVKEFTNKKDAEAYSSNNERVWINDNEISRYREHLRLVNAEAQKLWYITLYDTAMSIIPSEELFKLVYLQAQTLEMEGGDYVSDKDVLANRVIAMYDIIKKAREILDK